MEGFQRDALICHTKFVCKVVNVERNPLSAPPAKNDYLILNPSAEFGVREFKHANRDATGSPPGLFRTGVQWLVLLGDRRSQPGGAQNLYSDLFVPHC